MNEPQRKRRKVNETSAVTLTLATPNAEPEAAVYGKTGTKREIRRRATKRTKALAAVRIQSCP